MKAHALAFGSALALLLVAPRAQARRYAFLVGDNTGDAADERLRFAHQDAQRMAAVLTELGGVSPGDEVLLLEQSASEVEHRLELLLQRLQVESHPGDQLVLYFSGHADEGELHLDGGRLPLALLNDYARRAPIDVVLLVIDSCRSGAITRLKGLRPLGPSGVSIDVSTMKGRVVIGSSGPDEYAQESDTLGGSYFTSHLVAGLRGAADSSHDGVVTLDEAYAYAYAHTIESTFGTRGGVQHPSYHMDLRGQGELTLTRPASSRGRLRLEVADPAELTITGRASGTLVGEFIKSEGPAVLAVPPGPYRVRMSIGGQVSDEDVVVPDGGEAVVDARDLMAVANSRTALKGGAAADLDLSVGAAFGTGLTSSVPSAPGFEIGFALRKPKLLGPLNTITASLVARQATALATVHYAEQAVDGRAGLAFALDFWRLRARLGPEFGLVLVHQTGLPGDATRFSVAPEGGIAAAAELKLFGPVFLVAEAFGGAAHLESNVSSRFVPRGDFALGLAVRI